MIKIYNFDSLGPEIAKFGDSNPAPELRSKSRTQSLCRHLFLLLGLLFALSFNYANAQDTDLDGVPDNVDMDDDNDGILDFREQLPSIVGAFGGGSGGISVYTSNGDGTFNSTPISSGTGGGTLAEGAYLNAFGTYNQAYSLDIADVDADGDMDIVHTNHAGQVQVHLSDGFGSFPVAMIQTNTGGPLGNGYYTPGPNNFRGTNVGDINNDNFPDIVATRYNDQIYVYTGIGDGTFNTAAITSSVVGYPMGEGSYFTSANTSNQCFSTDLADVNQDGNLDVISTAYTGGIYVALGNGTGSFGTPISSTIASGPLGNGVYNTGAPAGFRGTNVGDVNGDSFPDIVAGRSGDGIYVYTGNGDGTFNSTVIYSNTGGTLAEGASWTAPNSSNQSYSLDLIDLDQDGNLDLINTNHGGGIQVHYGDGAGNFSAPKTSAISAAYFGNGLYNSGFPFTFRGTNLALINVDTDGDGLADHIDLDSDGDGIPDNIEAQTTAGFVVPGTAIDAQGRLIAYGPDGVIPNDDDGDLIGDWRDLDTDRDGDNDVTEAGLTLAGTDADGDGLDDNIDDDDTQFGSADNSTNAGITNVLTQYTNNGTEVKWRTVDRDLDGVEDYVDLDDDNDGIFDVAEKLAIVVVADNSTGNTHTYTSNGDGTFNATPINSLSLGGSFPEGDNAANTNEAYSTDIADVNGDGIFDIVVTGEPWDRIEVHLGNSNGTFGSVINTTGITGRLGNGYATSGGGNWRATNLADANQDGLADVIVGDNSTGNVHVYTSNGDGTFNTAPISSLSLGGSFVEGDNAANANEAYSTDMVDVNGDGIADIVVTGEPWDRIEVHLGNGDGTFGAVINTTGITGRLGNGYATLGGGNWRATNLADANQDDLADVIVADNSTGNVHVYTSNGDGTFNAASINSLGLGGSFVQGDNAANANEAYSTDMVDVNGDGIADIVVTGEPWDRVEVHLGNGDGTFGSVISTTGITGRLGDGHATLGGGNWRATNLSYLIKDTDADGIADHLDLDSDNDGIPDNIEAQTTAGYTAPTGTVNTQGVDLAYIGGLSPVDTENDTIPDYIDTDADNDGLTDLLESQLTVSGTVGYNGMDANVEATDDYSDVNGTIDTPLNLPDSDSDGEADFRDLPAPGGINSGLAVWLKANSGFTSSAWIDYSGNNNHTTQGTPANQPGWAPSFFNYNPTLTYDGNDLMAHADELGGIFQGVNANTIFMMMKNGNSTQVMLAASGACGDQFGLIRDVGGTFDVTRCGTSSEIGHPLADGTITIRSVTRGNNDTYDFYTDHGTPVSGAGVQSFSAGAGSVHWGGGLGNPFFTGAQAEGIIYDRELTAMEMQRVHSYMAIKYGITLDQTTPTDYLASDGATIIWDASVTPAYNNDIIGIGEDNSQGLYQKQSHTEDDTTNLFISTLMADNASNTGDVTNDLSYIVMGDNGGSMLGIQSEMPAGIYSRLGREWKVTNTNFIDDFSVEWEVGTTSPINLADLRLLVDDDGDFSNATIINTPDVTFALGSVIVSGIGLAEIPANSTRYITLASVDAATPLPIALTVFTAESNGDHVDLKWETTSELNNDYFTVEKSQDGSEWREVLQVPGAGTTSEPRSYHDIDPDPYLGLSYYRLKQTDYSGEETYSNIAAVSFEGNLMTAFPNPVNAGEALQLRFLDIIEGDVQITLKDILGKEYAVKTFKDENNTNSVIIKLGDTISSGVYQIVVSYRGMINVLRIVVE